MTALTRHRRPGGDRAALIDACIVATSVGLVAQVYVIGPLVTSDTPWAERVISAAYPVADLALLGVAARLALSGGRREPSYRFVGVGVVALLAADVGYALIQLTGSFQLGSPFDAAWMAFYVSLGLSALHPTMGSVTSRPKEAGSPPGSLRVIALSSVVLVAPALLVVNVLTGHAHHLPVIAAASVVLFLLVMARMSGLMSRLRATSERDRILRGAAGGLVAATDRDEICTAGVSAARALVGVPDAVVRLALSAANHSIRPAVPLPPGPGEAKRSGLGSFAETAEPEAASSEQVAAVTHELLADGGGPKRLVTPVVLQDELRGAIVVASQRALPSGLGQALDILSSLLTMALESSALTEDLHWRRGEARFDSMVQNSSDVIILVDVDTTVRYQTPSIRRVLGYEPGELAGTRLVDLVHPSDLPRALEFFDEAATVAGTSGPVEMRTRRPDGSWTDVEVAANNLSADPDVRGMVINIRDVSERRSLEREIVHQAFHDPLTGLADRALFNDRCQQARRRAARDAPTAAVLFVDLDDFKAVNDGLGLPAGDLLLVEVGARLVRSPSR